MSIIGPGVPAGGAPMAELSATALWVAGLLAGAAILALLFYLLGRGRASTEARAGLILGLRGLVAKELRTRSRGWRPAWLLTGYLGALTLGVAGFLALLSRAGGVIPPTMGIQLFSALALGAVLLLAFITPALTVGAVSGERERRTLDLLLVTRASPLGLAGGKLAGSLVYILFLLAASLPAFAVVYLFGGVPPLYLAMALAVAAVTAIAHAALGLLLSAVLRRTLVASVVAYLVVIGLVLGLPFMTAVLGVTQQVQRSGAPQPPGPPSTLLYASPVTSLASVMPSGSSGYGVPLMGDLLRLGLGASSYGFVAQPTGLPITRTVYVVGSDPTTGQVETAVGWAAWVYHFAFSGAFTLLCLIATAMILAPRKRLRLRW